MLLPHSDGYRNIKKFFEFSIPPSFTVREIHFHCKQTSVLYRRDECEAKRRRNLYSLYALICACNFRLEIMRLEAHLIFFKQRTFHPTFKNS